MNAVMLSPRRDLRVGVRARSRRLRDIFHKKELSAGDLFVINNSLRYL